MNEHGEYLKEEQGDYDPPACPECGESKDVDWVRSNPGREPYRYLPGLETCLNSVCRLSPNHQAD